MGEYKITIEYIERLEDYWGLNKDSIVVKL